ncbi:AAA family ATPase [Vallitalea pronyensis]|uniref:AAA family ATPase n=1 Tax=Vallitalea pronyensis TaxID=1348613 RepID=A0A8J8SES4_9FIRM|nr:AAA family ATPase [Vallitalea pronyensis]QUI20845.1 AAA family ATPase [Vallitalea pronyensis]
MHIKKAHLISFGKYQNQVLTLDKGINLLYGPNEAGKSTFHKFIEGMFYGFYKSHTKNKQYEDDYDQYLPWENSNQYKGILVYTHGGREYRMERNFMKRHDGIEMFDNQTGENITETFDYDKVIKLHQPAWKHLGINKSTFNNTISIGQLSSKTGEGLVKEVKDRLINLGESKDDEISVKNAMNQLDSKLGEIGTANRKKTSPYGKLVEKLKALKEEKDKAAKVWQQVMAQQEALLASKEALKTLEATKAQNEENLDLINLEKLQKQYAQAKAMQEAIILKKEAVETYKTYEGVDLQEIDQALKAVHTLQVNQLRQEELIAERSTVMAALERLYTQYDHLKFLDKHPSDLSELEEIVSTYHIYVSRKKEYEGLEQELKAIKPDTLEKVDGHQLIEDIKAYEQLENEKHYKQHPHPALALEEERYHQQARKVSKNKKWMFMGGIGCIVALGTGFMMTQWVITALGALFGLGVLVLLLLNKKENQHLKRLETTLNGLKQEEADQQKIIQDITMKQDILLKKNGCTHLEDLRQLKEQQAYQNMRYEEQKKRYDTLITNKNALEESNLEQQQHLQHWIALFLNLEEISKDHILHVKERYEDYKQLQKSIPIKEEERTSIDKKIEEMKCVMDTLDEKIKHIGSKYEAGTEEDFARVKEKKMLYNQLQQDLTYKEAMYHQLIGTTSLEELGATLAQSHEQPPQIKKTKEELEQEQKELVDKILKVNKEISGYESKIVNLEKEVRPLVDIEEDIDQMKQQRDKYDNKIKALTMAKEVIENISRDIQNNFAPKLNEKVSKIVGQITDQKYSDIKINPNMDVLTYEPNQLQLTAIEKLSKGTVDQMYFALRLSIIDVIREGETLPLILDDCFTQYDDDRLEKALQLLAQLDRQIIVLTCHEREGKLLDKMDVNYNKILLT